MLSKEKPDARMLGAGSDGTEVSRLLVFITLVFAIHIMFTLIFIVLAISSLVFIFITIGKHFFFDWLHHVFPFSAFSKRQLLHFSIETSAIEVWNVFRPHIHEFACSALVNFRHLWNDV